VTERGQEGQRKGKKKKESSVEKGNIRTTMVFRVFKRGEGEASVKGVG